MEKFGFPGIVFIIIFAVCVAMAIASPAQTFTSLHSFDGLTACSRQGKLIQGTDGNLYGTTSGGGTGTCNYGCGTVFGITPAGTVYPWSMVDWGVAPEGGLVLGADGNYYGTTSQGGLNTCHADLGCGMVFKFDVWGSLAWEYEFCGGEVPCSYAPYAGLVQGTDGNFYGTTYGGGYYGYGTVFNITAAGALTVLHSFDSTDGANPQASLIQGTDGNFYGTTSSGGTYGSGTVFKITPAGALTTLHIFDGTDGSGPFAELVQGTDGNFYGTTNSGGNNGYGTVFKITPAGALTTLHIFDLTDGARPQAGLIQATDGNFYGTTCAGGANSKGTLFNMTPAGVLTPLHSFDLSDGYCPAAALLQGTDGNFYGTTVEGGAYTASRPGGDACGTVFKFSMGLGPFVATVPTSGNVGATVIILGNNLSGATGVSFNGTAGDIHRGIQFSNRDRSAHRGNYRHCDCRDAQWHSPQQQELYRDPTPGHGNAVADFVELR